jgi:hypothetical protein
MKNLRIKVNGQVYSAEIINSQFCIKVSDDEIELIYDHRHQMMTVHVNSELTVQYHYYPTRESFNYVNLLDIAVRFRNQYYQNKKSKLQNWTE